METIECEVVIMAQAPADDGLSLNDLLYTYSFKFQFDQLIDGAVDIIPVPLSSPSPKSYKFTYQQTGGIEVSETLNYTYPNELVHSISGLAVGKEYTFSVQAYENINLGGAAGNKISQKITIPKPIMAAKMQIIEKATGLDQDVAAASSALANALVGEVTDIQLNSTNTERVERSILSISNQTTDKTDHNILYKSFDGMSLPPTFSSSVEPTGYAAPWSNYYYSFGTTIFLDDNIDNPNQAGGFAFFLQPGAQDGYLIEIDTTTNSVALKTVNEVRILKLKNGQKYRLNDSQDTEVTTLNGIYGGKAYRIDVKVKSSNTRTDFIVYVNGFKITASDIYVAPVGTTGPVTVHVPTKNIGGYAKTGIISFDYMYGISIDKADYENSEATFNVFTGQYSKNMLQFKFGEKILNAKSQNTIRGTIEEFGSVARELRNIKIRFNSRPGEPVYASTGINKFAEVLATKFNNFGAEVYVLNNSGTYVPLADDQDYDFTIPGANISQSGQQEYSSTVLNEYTVEEPVTFESMWIQNQGEAVALEEWIRSIWSKKQMTIELSVFGNPLIGVGDLVNINHAYQGLTDDRKFIVTSVKHSYNDGLETAIICKTL